MTKQETYYMPTKLDYLYDAAPFINDEVKLAHIINKMKLYQFAQYMMNLKTATAASIIIGNILTIIGVDLKKLWWRRALMSF